MLSLLESSVATMPGADTVGGRRVSPARARHSMSDVRPIANGDHCYLSSRHRLAGQARFPPFRAPDVGAPDGNADASQDRQVVRALNGEIAEIRLPATGSRITDAAIISYSSTMAKQVDAFLRRTPELASAGVVEAECDRRIVGTIVQ